VALLEGRDVVVWSPGIACRHPLAEAARSSGIPVMSELELGYRAASAPFICVTGTNGKSTTTDLIGALLREAGREVEVAGNIGRAICDVAERVSASGMLIVEVSSFQLETVDRLKPFVAVWLNLTPDHLDRHGDIESYASTKQRLFARQDEADYAVWNADDPEVLRHRAGSAYPLFFSLEHSVDDGAFLRGDTLWLAWRGGAEAFMPVADVKLRGRHNQANVLAALAAVLPLELPLESLRNALRTYGGLEHRLESVTTTAGVEFVNDSKATNTASLQVALESFDAPVVLIAGGRDKGQDFTLLAEVARRHVAHAVLMGEGASRIEAAWPAVTVHHAASLREAVRRAWSLARESQSGVVLLSPGCASFDMFSDYEDRGRHFKDEVGHLRLAST
jgi:UDP-N-acetylmuramoylalanine--D-glutamate ligase